jgi:hypothetical protein
MEAEDALEDPWGGGATSITATPIYSEDNDLPRSLNDASISPTLSPRFAQISTQIPPAEGDPLVHAVIEDTHLSDEEKTIQLQNLFSRAASNGDFRCVRTMLYGPARAFIDVDAEDEDGMTPLIHAACFGHANVVQSRISL